MNINNIITEAEKISDNFWHIVTLAKQDYDAYAEALEKMPKQDLFKFYWTYRFAVDFIKWEPYRDYLDENLSGDSVEDIALWIVAQGKEYFMSVINDPESTPNNIADPEPDCLFLADVIATYEDTYEEFIPHPDEGVEFLYP